VVLALPGQIREQIPTKAASIPLLAMGVPVFQSEPTGGFISKRNALTADFTHHTTGFILAFRNGD
jgi:hypothetical protein